ncbi:MAG TPA: GntR family transcriptional regulator [Thermoleophilaceae bacterium]|nr:GntR family transcriptional regulator [Thermoleophilaceae bacterium]
MRLQVDRDSGVPVGTQLAWRLRSAIERGELRPGDKLPSLREAAVAAGVNVNTVRAAYTKLEAAGVVTTEQGRGTFVARPSDGASDRRRALRDDIARLEAELVSLPLLPHAVGEPASRNAPGARLLSVEELETVRDVLADRVDELHSARAAVVARLQGERRAEPAATRAPARRSSSSLTGARVRWT